MGSMRISTNRLFIGVILAGQFMANVDTAIINVATPSIGATLHASGAELQLTVSAYVLAMAMLLITAARLGASYGYRRLFLAGLIIFTLASLGCGLAPGVFTLIVARVVQGAGAALMVAQVISGIQRTLTGTARTRAIGAYTITLSLSAVIGQILGGLLITANVFGLAWRPLFLINIPAGALLLVLAWRVMPHDERSGDPRPVIDLIGVGLLGLTMALLILPLTIGRELQWPPWTLASLVASATPATAFVWWQHRLGIAGRGPLLNLALFREPTVVPVLLSQLLARATYFSLLFVLALYVQTGLGQSALDSGLTLLSWVAAYGIAGFAYPRLPRAAAAWSGPLGAVVMAAAFAGTAVVTSFHAGTGPLLIAFLGCGGFGFGVLATATTAQLTTVVAKERAADLSGVLATMTPISAIAGIATFGSAYLALASPGGSGAALRAFAIVNAAYAVTVAIAAALMIYARSGSERVDALGLGAANLDLVKGVERNRDVGVA
jgi:MFS family permease